MKISSSKCDNANELTGETCIKLPGHSGDHWDGGAIHWPKLDPANVCGQRLQGGTKSEWCAYLRGHQGAHATLDGKTRWNTAADPESPYVPRKGDIVSIRATVTAESAGANGKLIGIEVDGGDAQLFVYSYRLTLIERPVPPEPDWQLGDLAEDENDKRYAYAGDGRWRELATDELWTRTKTFPGRLFRLTVTREGE